MTTIHIVSHTHWDREWYLPFQEFRLKLVLLIDRLLAIMRTNTDYRCFLLDGQTIVLDDYLAMRPERAGEIRELVRSSRLQVGPWHILPDEFLVSPEATIRNLLQGQRSASQYGKPMRAGYIPDPFGHIAQMPQILRGFEIETACVWRGLSDEPCEFWWQAPDGSRVLMAYLRDGYHNAARLPVEQPERFCEQAARVRDALLPHTAGSHLLFMHGNDHQLPNPATLQSIAFANQHMPGDRLVHSSLPEYLQAIQTEIDLEKLPVIQGELRSSKRSPLLPGVLSTRVWIKQRNQACQNLLEKWVEPLSVWSSLLSEPDQAYISYLGDTAPIIRSAWRLLMENHPHDSICGCSIDQVHEEMRPRFDQVKQIGERLAAQSLDRLSAAIDTRPPAALAQDGDILSAALVFNPHSAPQSGVVSLQLPLPFTGQALEVVAGDSQVVPSQSQAISRLEITNTTFDRAGLKELLGVVQNGSITGLSIQAVEITPLEDSLWLEVSLAEKLPPNPGALEKAGPAILAALADDRIQRFHVHASVRTAGLTFTADAVPGHGWRCFWVRPARQVSQPAPLDLAGPVIENDFLRVSADPEDGSLTLLDKRSGHIFKNLHRFSDGGDCGDEYNYAPPARDEVVTRPVVRSIHARRDNLGEHLEISLSLEIPAGLSPDRLSRSDQRARLEIASRISLSPGLPRLDFHTQVDNPARDHRMRVHFPVPIQVEKASYEGHFAVLERPLALPEADPSWIEQPRPEAPQLAFADLSAPGRGLMLANRGLPEVSALPGEDGSELALTLLRCTGWLSRDDFSTRRGHAGPLLATPGAQQIGQHDFDYALIPHAGNWQEVFPLAHGFAEPLRVWSASLEGDRRGLPSQGAFLQVEPGSFVVSAVKLAEDGAGWVLRGYNMSDQPIQARTKPGLPFGTVWRASLSEQRLEELSPGPDGTIELEVQPWQIVTLRFSPTETFSPHTRMDSE